MNSALFVQCFANPAIISLVVGCIFGTLSNFVIPRKISFLVALYLVFSIGLKGGLCLGVDRVCTPPLTMLAAIGLLIGFLQPFFYFFILPRVASLDIETRTVVASQFGSISIVTFVTALSFLQQNSVQYSTFMTALAGMMELPAIFSGLFLLKLQNSKVGSYIQSFMKIVFDIFSSPKISFIFLGFLVGIFLRNHADSQFINVFLQPFNSMLVIFMVDIGISIANQREHLQSLKLPLILFGIYVPIITGLGGIAIAYACSVSVGTALLFAVLIASASYIAVPAIMHTQAPQAKKAVYLPLALCITLPFNLIFGIPFFYYIAKICIAS